jgi:heme exporter protein B
VLALRGFLTIVRWDFVLELRRREAVLNMTLFAVLVLFIASYALSDRPGLQAEVGPLILWIAILFAGTVGLSRAFLMERESGALSGILLTPLDAGFFYFAKVAATWLYVMAMEVLLLGAYVVLFNFSLWSRLPLLLATMASFTLAYVAAGSVIAAMTSSLRGGEIVLRILLFPIMIPVVVIAVTGGEAIFPALPPPGAPGAV